MVTTVERGGARPATLGDMEAIAMRYDTAMSRAMLRALGKAPSARRPMRLQVAAKAVERERYRGVARAFRQSVGCAPRSQTLQDEASPWFGRPPGA